MNAKDIVRSKAIFKNDQPSEPWAQGKETEFIYLPAGVHTINAGFRGKSINLTVAVNKNTAEAVQASFEEHQKSRPKQKPYGCVEHREQEASVIARGFGWRDDGVVLTAEPTALGEQNVNGRIHWGWSPSFYTDADYAKAKFQNETYFFPDGVRGSKSNPAEVVGVAFCVGTLTNNPAFHEMPPVKAKESANDLLLADSSEDKVDAAGTSEGVKKSWEHRPHIASYLQAVKNAHKVETAIRQSQDEANEYDRHFDGGEWSDSFHQDIANKRVENALQHSSLIGVNRNDLAVLQHEGIAALTNLPEDRLNKNAEAYHLGKGSAPAAKKRQTRDYDVVLDHLKRKGYGDIPHGHFEGFEHANPHHVSMTDSEYAERLHEQIQSSSSHTPDPDKLTASGTSEGVKKSWAHRHRESANVALKQAMASDAHKEASEAASAASLHAYKAEAAAEQEGTQEAFDQAKQAHHHAEFAHFFARHRAKNLEGGDKSYYARYHDGEQRQHSEHGKNMHAAWLNSKPTQASSVVDDPDKVTATWSDAARQAAAESKKRNGLEGAKFEKSPAYLLKWAAHHGDMVEHHEEELRMQPTDKKETLGHEEARHIHSQAEHHYTQAANHLAAGNHDRASLHLSRAERYSVDASTHTPDPDKVTATWSPQAREAALEARRNSPTLSKHFAESSERRTHSDKSNHLDANRGTTHDDVHNGLLSEGFKYKGYSRKGSGTLETQTHNYEHDKLGTVSVHTEEHNPYSRNKPSVVHHAIGFEVKKNSTKINSSEAPTPLDSIYQKHMNTKPTLDQIFARHIDGEEIQATWSPQAREAAALSRQLNRKSEHLEHHHRELASQYKDANVYNDVYEEAASNSHSLSSHAFKTGSVKDHKAAFDAHEKAAKLARDRGFSGAFMRHMGEADKHNRLISSSSHTPDPDKVAAAESSAERSEAAKKGWEHRTRASHAAFEAGKHAIAMNTASAHAYAAEEHQKAADTQMGDEVDTTLQQAHQALAERHRKAAEELTTKATALSQREPIHQGRGSILGIGSVNLESGENEMFGHIHNGWSEGKGLNLLFNREGKMIAVHTSGNSHGFIKGDTMDFEHDQTRRHMGRGTFVSSHPNTIQGLKDIKSQSGKNKLNFYTFK